MTATQISLNTISLNSNTPDNLWIGYDASVSEVQLGTSASGPSVRVTSSGINNTEIGATTAAAGAFTNLSTTTPFAYAGESFALDFNNSQSGGGVFYAGLAAHGGLGGKVTSGQAYVYSLNVDDDNLDTMSSGGPGGATTLWIGHAISAGATGGRVAVFASLNQEGATTVGDSSFYVGLASGVYGNHSAGGTSSSLKGHCFGANPLAVLTSGATYWFEVVGTEIDFGARSGATGLGYKVGLKIVLDGEDAVAGSAENVGLSFALGSNGGTTSSPGLTNGIQFGAPEGWWPINTSTGTLIGTQVTGLSPSGPSYQCAYGINFSEVTFSTAAFKSANFEVDGSGNTTAASFAFGSGGPTWTSGSGVPTSVQPNGSLYSRTSGTTGARLYVSAGGGTWAAVPGV